MNDSEEDPRHMFYLIANNYKDQFVQTDSFILSESDDRCISCNKSINFLSNNGVLLLKLTCNHCFCLSCLKKFAAEQIQHPQNQNIRCPLCGTFLREEEISKICPEYNQILEKRINEYIKEEFHIIHCPKCHEPFAYEPGQVAGIFIDSNGRKIRSEAVECLRLYRAKCTKCNSTFCVNCRAEPFHEGLTCEENKIVSDGIVCRFCRTMPPIGGRNVVNPCERVCWQVYCQESLKQACMHLISKCNHPCCGIRDETEHFGCAIDDSDFSMCSFCYGPCTESPSIKMACGHPSHLHCLIELYKTHSLKGKLNIPRCNHGQTCKAIPFHKCVENEANLWIDIQNQIEEQIPNIMAEENTENESEHVQNPDDSDYYHHPLKFARDFFEFYMCDSCHKPYYGGHKDCNQDSNENEENVEHKCLRCQRELLSTNCPIHGNDFMVFKCCFCCNPSAYFCWGRVYFCADCHENPNNARKNPKPCNGHCKFSPHQPNGVETPVGYCAKCEEEKYLQMTHQDHE